VRDIVKGGFAQTGDRLGGYLQKFLIAMLNNCDALVAEGTVFRGVFAQWQKI
jgi:hypothetical protein